MSAKRVFSSLPGRLLLAAALAVLGLLLWNLPVAVSYGAPYVISLVPALAPQVAQAADNTIIYPALGISAPVSVQPGVSPLRTSDWGTIRGALLKGTALSYDGAVLETAPIAFLTGHSSDTYPHPYSSVFAGLGSAKVGDEFTLTTGGTAYPYRVVEKKVLDPSKPDGFAALKPVSGSQRLVLVTCWPVFTTASRLAVVGERL